MALDEAMAYALASWNRFEEELPDDFLKALCGAFAVVAVADGRLDPRESERFLQMLREHLDILPRLDLDHVERRFRELTDALLTDPVGGRQHALEDIARIRGQVEQREMVQSAARLAVIADGRIDPSETRVLEEISRALGCTS